MKCPKCKLVTFDHLSKCPRCRASFDLSRRLTHRRRDASRRILIAAPSGATTATRVARPRPTRTIAPPATETLHEIAATATPAPEQQPASEPVTAPEPVAPEPVAPAPLTAPEQQPAATPIPASPPPPVLDRAVLATLEEVASSLDPPPESAPEAALPESAPEAALPEPVIDPSVLATLEELASNPETQSEPPPAAQVPEPVLGRAVVSTLGEVACSPAPPPDEAPEPVLTAPPSEPVLGGAVLTTLAAVAAAPEPPRPQPPAALPPPMPPAPTPEPALEPPEPVSEPPVPVSQPLEPVAEPPVPAPTTPDRVPIEHVMDAGASAPPTATPSGAPRRQHAIDELQAADAGRLKERMVKASQARRRRRVDLDDDCIDPTLPDWYEPAADEDAAMTPVLAGSARNRA